MKSLADQTEFTSMYGVVPSKDPSDGFTLFDKYIYYRNVYSVVFCSIKSDDWWTSWQPKFFALCSSADKLKDVSSPEELGMLAALCPAQAKEIFLAAFFSGFSNSAYFNQGKTYAALHSLCQQDPSFIAASVQDSDFPDLVKLTFLENYFDQCNGLF